jgi:hypothetical protein
VRSGAERGGCERGGWEYRGRTEAGNEWGVEPNTTAGGQMTDVCLTSFIPLVIGRAETCVYPAHRILLHRNTVASREPGAAIILDHREI